MTRMLTDVELTYLTIARLQALLKAARARMHNTTYCDCCGESVLILYPDELHPYQEAAINYVKRIKKQLYIRQGTIK